MTGELGLLGLVGLFGAVAFGAVVPVVPTGAAVSAAAVLARTERPWEIVLVVVVGGFGAYVGDVITYAALRYAGPPLAQRVGWLRTDDPEGALRRLRSGIETHEVRTLLLSRLLPGGRVPVLLAAALGGYPLVKFASADVAAALLWATMYAAIGVAGNSVLHDTTTAVVVAVVVAVLVGALASLVRRSR